MWGCVCRSQRLAMGVSLCHSLPYFLRQGLSMNLKLISSDRLASQWVPGIPLSLPPWCWDYRYTGWRSEPRSSYLRSTFFNWVISLALNVSDLTSLNVLPIRLSSVTFITCTSACISSANFLPSDLVCLLPSSSRLHLHHELTSYCNK